MVVASSTIPFIFPAIKEKTEYGYIHLVDGGVIGKRNIDFSFFNDVDRIFVISNVCDEDYFFKPQRLSLKEIFEKRVRKILVYQNKKIEKELSKLSSIVYFIKPQKPLDGRILDFNPSKSIQLYKEGFDYGKSFLNDYDRT